MAEWIDEAGGEVASADGRVRVKVPAGAWQGRRAVEISTLPSILAATIGGRTVRGVHHLSLVARDAQGHEDSSPFAQAVELSLQFDSGDFARTIVADARFAWWNPVYAAWEDVPNSFDRSTLILTTKLSHFSEYLGAVDPTSNILPTVDGFAVDLAHGNATVNLPLKVPPGPHGFQPSLTLTYSSGGPNGVISEDPSTYEHSQGSWVGFGWDLSMGYILVAGFLGPQARMYLTLNNRTYDLIQTETINFDGLYRTRTTSSSGFATSMLQ